MLKTSKTTFRVRNFAVERFSFEQNLVAQQQFIKGMTNVCYKIILFSCTKMKIVYLLITTNVYIAYQMISSK